MMTTLVSTGLNGLYVKLIIQVKLDAPKKRTHIYKKLLAIYLQLSKLRITEIQWSIYW